MAPTKQAKSDEKAELAEAKKRSEAAKKAAETRARNKAKENEAPDAQAEPGAHAEQDRVDHLQGGVKTQPKPNGPLAGIATPDQAEGNKDFEINPAVHAMNRLRRISEVQGYVKHADVARIYDELGLDWQAWRDTVRGE